MSKNRKESPFHTGTMTEGPHRSRFSADLHESSLNGVGGADDRESQFQLLDIQLSFLYI